MEINKKVLKDWGACSEGFKWFVAKFPQGAQYQEVSSALREEKRYGDYAWLNTNVFNTLFNEPAQISDFVKSDVAHTIAEATELTAASGYNSKLAASGYNSKLAASGYNSKLAASGYNSKLAASGYNSTLAASGDDSTLAASGNYSTLAASGNYSTLAASGNYSTLEAKGKCSVAMSAGLGSCASASEGGAFALAWKDGEQMRIAVGVVGENGIKSDVIYRVGKTGELEEVAA